MLSTCQHSSQGFLDDITDTDREREKRERGPMWRIVFVRAAVGHGLTDTTITW